MHSREGMVRSLEQTYEMASLDTITDTAMMFVDCVLDRPDFPLEPALDVVLAGVPAESGTDRWTEIACMRQQQWLLMNWLAGINELVPRGIAEEAIAWVRRHVGRKAAKSCEAHAWVLGRTGTQVDRVVQDWNRVERITAWVRLLAAVTTLHGDGTAAWLRRFDPPLPTEKSTLAWLVGCEPPDWTPLAWPPDPRMLPELRRKLMKFVDHSRSRAETNLFFAERVLCIGPAPCGNSLAGDLLADQEVERLSKARLYFVDPDMCAVALRKRDRPRNTPVTPHRVPSPNGMIFFAEPLLYESPMVPGVVAASWSRWDPGSSPDGWLQLSELADDDTYSPMEFGDGPHWWITLYHVQDDVIGDERDTPPLGMSGTYALSDGQIVEQPTEDQATLAVARVVIACWDLITQEQIGKPITDTTLLQRKPAKTRADRRRGIADDGVVRLVSVRGRPQAAADGPAAAAVPAQRSPGNYKHRWTVQEHSRSHCMNPRGHAEGDCTHEDITILDFVKGPPGAPFLRRDIVHILRKLEQ